MTHVKLWLWLTTRKGIQSRHITRLLEYFEHPERIYYADPALYDQVPHLSPGVKESLKQKDTGEAERILERCERLGVRILTLQDAYYPARLKEIYDPPAVLYLKGSRLLPDDEPVIAMVGARDATEYGLRVAQRLSWELVRSGATVVSGIARGIDAAVLTGALRELLGSASFAGISLQFQPPLPMLLHPSGGLILLILLLTAIFALRRREHPHADCD